MTSDGSETSKDHLQVVRDMMIDDKRCTLQVEVGAIDVKLQFRAVRPDGTTAGTLNGVIARDDLVAVTKALGATLSGAAVALGQTRPNYNANLEEVRKIHPRAYEPWTADDDTRLIERYHDGASTHDLCNEFGRNPGGIIARLKMHGLSPDALDGRQGGSGSVEFDFDGPD